MIIKYEKGKAIALGFQVTEFRAVIYILKAIYKVSPLAFIREAIDDIEADMKPPVLIFNNHHICEHCMMMMDERDPNSFHLTERSVDGKETSKWIHYTCKPLKQRPT